jgi:hypothetical protein
MACTDSKPNWLDYLPPIRCQATTYILHLGIRAFQQEAGNSACDGDRIGNEPYDRHRCHSTGASHLWR